MKIFRELVETEGAGWFLVDAIHDGETIQSIKVFPVYDDTIQPALSHTMEDLTILTTQLQKHLTASL
jgi:hypothetical protein